MILTSTNIIPYLLERGLLSAESIVDGDVMVVAASSRNRNFKIMRRQAHGYFVKQVQNWDAQSVGTLQCEANCYWLTQSDPAFAALAQFVPRFYDLDRNRNVLVTELLPESESLYERHRRLGQFPEELAAALGKVLGTYHSKIKIEPGDITSYPSFPRNIPWILSAHKQTDSSLNKASGGNAQVFEILQSYPEFQQELDALYNGWQPQSLTHGDVKWENFILSHEQGKNEAVQLKLIDWEVADIGDPLWDVGAVFQSYLSFWVFSIPTDVQASPSQLAERARYPLEAMQPAMRAFWKAYTEERGMPAALANEWLQRSASYAAARMIQTVYEYMSYYPQANASALFILQVSQNILKSPREAVSDLLGI